MSRNVFRLWKFLDSMRIHVNGQILYKTLTIECVINVVSQMRFDERLLSVPDGEAKRTLISIGRNDLFYATAMKTLKSNFLGIQW